MSDGSWKGYREILFLNSLWRGFVCVSWYDNKLGEEDPISAAVSYSPGAKVLQANWDWRSLDEGWFTSSKDLK